MSHDAKVAILREIFPDFKIRKGSEFVTRCPSKECRTDPNRHSKMKLEVSLENNSFACWRCHYSGHVLKLVRQHGTTNQRTKYSSLLGVAADQSTNKLELTLPVEYKFVLDNKNSRMGSDCLEWLVSKGISEETVLQNKVGYCEEGDYAGRVLFPSFAVDGSLNYFVTRHLYRDYFKWLKCKAKASQCVWNELFVDWSRQLLITESVKTYLKYFQDDLNIISNNGTTLTKRHMLFSKILIDSCCDVVIMFDPEAKMKAYEVAKELYKFDCKILVANPRIQPDDMTKEEFYQTINEAKEFKPGVDLRERIANL